MYDHRAQAEIAVLTDVIAMIDARLAEAARAHRYPGTGRALIYATVLYELLASAREVHGPDAGRVYAAPLLDSIIEATPAEAEVTSLEQLVTTTIGTHITPVN